MSSEQMAFEGLMPSSGDSPAKTSLTLDDVLALLEASGHPSSSSLRDWLDSFDHAGFSSRTSLAFCHREDDGTWVSSSGRWLSSGMASPGVCLTLSTSEFPSDADVCSLSDILEPLGPQLAKFFLSEKAAKGILRRAERRGRALPTGLRRALEATAGVLDTTETTES